jgi:hypothetical protein
MMSRSRPWLIAAFVGVLEGARILALIHGAEVGECEAPETTVSGVIVSRDGCACESFECGEAVAESVLTSSLSYENNEQELVEFDGDM